MGVHEDYKGLLFCLKCGSYTLKYGGNSLCASLCRHFRIFKENVSSTFSNLIFFKEVQYVQYNDYAL